MWKIVVESCKIAAIKLYRTVDGIGYYDFMFGSDLSILRIILYIFIVFIVVPWYGAELVHIYAAYILIVSFIPS